MINYTLNKLAERKAKKCLKNIALVPTEFDLFISKKYNLYLTDFTLQVKVKITSENMVVKTTYDILAIPQEKEK